MGPSAIRSISMHASSHRIDSQQFQFTDTIFSQYREILIVFVFTGQTGRQAFSRAFLSHTAQVLLYSSIHHGTDGARRNSQCLAARAGFEPTTEKMPSFGGTQSPQ
jgi:hypothetical protein